MVFSWSRCPFCIRGKEVLKSTGARFTALEIDQMPEGE